MTCKRIDCYEPFDEAELVEEACWAGMDLGIVDDLCSCVYAFPWANRGEEKAAELYRVLPRFWIPGGTVKRYKDLVSYAQWADEGWVKITDGDEVDFSVIRDDIAADSHKFRIQDLRYDRAYGATVAQDLELEHGIIRKEFPQTIMHFTFPCKMLERLIKKRAIRHNGNKCLTWQIGNASIKQDPNNNIRPVKPPKEDFRKIDGVVAMVMALSGAIGEREAGAYYEENDPELV